MRVLLASTFVFPIWALYPKNSEEVVRSGSRVVDVGNHCADAGN